jgi:hypothetical protein
MPRKRSLSVDLACNLAWPFAVLTWASGEDLLGPRWAPAVAMAAPLGFAVYRRVTEGRTSALSVLVVVSILLNAAAGFLPLDARWFAAKEALLPVGFGLLFAGTALRGPGLLADIIHELVDAEKLAVALAARGATAPYTARLRRGTVRFGAVFGLSGALGGALALALVRAPTGTPAFAEELGRYTAWSYAAVNLPVLLASAWVLQDVLKALEEGTGRSFEELQA